MRPWGKMLGDEGGSFFRDGRGELKISVWCEEVKWGVDQLKWGGKLGFQQPKSGFTMFHQQQGDIVSRCFKNFKNNKCDVKQCIPQKQCKNTAKTVRSRFCDHWSVPVFAKHVTAKTLLQRWNFQVEAPHVTCGSKSDLVGWKIKIWWTGVQLFQTMRWSG